MNRAPTTRTIIVNGEIKRVPVRSGTPAAASSITADVVTQEPLIDRKKLPYYVAIVAALMAVSWQVGVHWGSVLWICAAIVAIFTLGLGRGRTGLSAYSMFNAGGQTLLGQLRASQFDAEVRGGAAAVAAHDAGNEAAAGGDDDGDAWAAAGEGQLLGEGGGAGAGVGDADDAVFAAELQEALARSQRET